MNKILSDIRKLAEGIANAQASQQPNVMVEQIENHRARARMIVELVDANEQLGIMMKENGTYEE